MKCPYCAQEMEKGLIQSPQEISWIKGENRTIFSRAKFHNDAVILSELSFMNGSAVISYLCRDCKKVIIDFFDGQSDLNQS